MPEHLLDGAQVGAALEQVRRERVPEQVGMHALRVEPRLLGEPPKDQERARAGEAAAAGVQEQLRAVTRVEIRTAAREVAAQRLDRRPADRDDALLAALADDAHEPPVEVDAGLAEPDRLRDAETGAVEQLDERVVAQVAGLRPSAASISRSASPAESVFGSIRARRGSESAAAGLSLRRPSSCRCL